MTGCATVTQLLNSLYRALAAQGQCLVHASYSRYFGDTACAMLTCVNTLHCVCAAALNLRSLNGLCVVCEQLLRYAFAAPLLLAPLQDRHGAAWPKGSPFEESSSHWMQAAAQRKAVLVGECEAELNKVMPPLLKVLKELRYIDKGSIAELKVSDVWFLRRKETRKEIQSRAQGEYRAPYTKEKNKLAA
eukprot:1158137-Pelagomonas_calceolata.AAC.15